VVMGGTDHGLEVLVPGGGAKSGSTFSRGPEP